MTETPNEQPAWVYVYVEYCPAEFFRGWWLYAAPIVGGQPDRDNARWLASGPWIDGLMRILGLPDRYARPGYQNTRANDIEMDRQMLDDFDRRYPMGVVMLDTERGFEALSAEQSVDLWPLWRKVRELQFKDWQRSLSERQD